MAKVTPNIAGLTVPGVINKRIAVNPNKSIGSVTSDFAGLDPTYSSGNTQRVVGGDHFSARNAGSMKVFKNEAKRPGTDNIDQAFYAHIS